MAESRKDSNPLQILSIILFGLGGLVMILPFFRREPRRVSRRGGILTGLITGLILIGAGLFGFLKDHSDEKE